MFYSKNSSEYGNYKQEDGTRVDLFSAKIVGCPPGQTPEDNGWYEFPTKEDCLKEWGLTYSPYEFA